MPDETRVLYKLTTQGNRTRVEYSNETLWGPNICHKPQKEGKPVLCSATVIHAYEHPLIAAFMNPQHAAIYNPKLWMCVGTPVVFDSDLKCGCTSLTTCQEIPFPAITTEQYVRIAKSAAEYAAKSAESAKSAAKSAAKYAKYAKYAEYATKYAKSAKSAAEYAKYATEYAKSAKSAKYAVKSAVKSVKSAAEYAKYAVKSAEYAAEYAKYVAKPFSLLEILLKAIPEYKGYE